VLGLFFLLLLLFRPRSLRLRARLRCRPWFRGRRCARGLRTFAGRRSLRPSSSLRPIGLRPIFRLGSGWPIRLRPIVRLGGRWMIGLGSVRVRFGNRCRRFWTRSILLWVSSRRVGWRLNCCAIHRSVIRFTSLLGRDRSPVVEGSRFRSGGDGWCAVIH
jgi:hypothetical protein